MDAYSTGMLLVVIGWIGVVGLMVFIYRRRRATRERAREERYRHLIAATLAGGAGAVAPAVGGAPTPPREARTHPASTTSPAPGFPADRDARAIAARGSGAAADPDSRLSGTAGAAAAVRPAQPSAPSVPLPAEPAAAVPDPRAQALRMADALMAMRPGGASAGASSATAAAPPAPMRVRSPLLEAPARAMLLALRTAAPGHEVLVAPSLARLLDAPAGLSGLDRSMRLRQAAALAVDFAVCTRAMELVATVDLQGQGMPSAEREARRAAAAQLEAAGVRHLVFDPAQLPRYPELRALIGLAPPGDAQ